MKKAKRIFCALLALLTVILAIPAVSAEEEMRIVCLAPDMVEVVYALGCGDKIVGWSAYTDYPVEVEERDGWRPYGYYYYTDVADFDVAEELSHEVATVSKFYDCNYDIIEGLKPTIILGSEDAQVSMVEDLKSKGYNAYCYTYTTLEDVFSAMLSVGELLGVKETAEALVAGYRADIEEIKAVTANLTPIPVYFEIAHQTDYGEWGVYGPYTTAQGTPFEEMIAIAGGTNIFSDMEGSYVEVTFEDIASRDPAVILSPYWPDAMDEEVTSIYEIMTRPGFDQVRAVKTGRVYFYDSSLLKRYGPRTVTAIKKLAYLLHPYYFDNPENSVSPWELGKIDVDEKPLTSLR